MPGRGLSRTRSLLAGRAFRTHAEFYWRYDPFTFDTWAKVLNYQRDKGRDVFGLSDDSTDMVRRQALAKWGKWKKSGAPIPVEFDGIKVLGPERGTTPEGPKPPRTNLEFATLGIGDTSGIFGGFTEQELNAAFREKSAAHVQGRSGESYNRLLSHIWGHGGQETSAGGAVVPLTPKPKIAAMRKAKVEVKAETFDEAVEELIAKSEGLNREKQIQELIEKYSKPGPNAAVHGMTIAEDFRTFEYAGIKWYYVEGRAGDAAYAVHEIQHSIAVIPKRLMEATKEAWFSTQFNRADEYWQRTYKDFTRSNATGGEGTTMVYKEGSMRLRTFTHESGHSLADKLYGSSFPGGDYAKIVAENVEPPVSEYAKNSSSEDFAESCRAYVGDKAYFQKKCPKRYEIIHRIMTESSYGG